VLITAFLIVGKIRQEFSITNKIRTLIKRQTIPGSLKKSVNHKLNNGF
jgi:hypothetical protein